MINFTRPLFGRPVTSVMFRPMAPPQFPSITEPLFGAGPEGDPGYLASLRTGPVTMLRQLRITMLTLVTAPVLILAIVPFIVRGGKGVFGGLPVLVFAPLVVAFVVALAVGIRVPRALPVGLADRSAAQAGAMAFRQALFLRFALADAVVLLGLPLSIISHSEMPYAAGFVLGFPLLVLLALPTRGTVERMRRRLEADGTPSHLWAVLLAPAG
jgi:hypothetical protein